MPLETLDLTPPSNEHDNCAMCKRCNFAIKPFIEARGVEDCDVLFVGSQPTIEENRRGISFMGEYASYLEQLIAQVKLNDYKIAKTLSIRCGGEKKVSAKQHGLCKNFTYQDIEKYKPKLIILLGAVALKTVLGLAHITNRRGTIIYDENHIFLPTFHPDIVLQDKNNEHWLINDLQQAKDYLDELYGKVRKKERIAKRYRILYSLDEIEEFTEKALQCKTPIAYDTEFEPLDIWLAEKPICLGVSFSLEPFTGIFIPYEHPESKWTPTEKARVLECIRLILRTKKLIVHNAEPDVGVAVRCFGMKIEELNVAFDTMRASMCIFGPKATHRLKNLAFSYADTGGYDEDVERFKKENKVNTYGDIPLEMLGAPYAAGDTDTTAQIARNLSPKIAQMGQKKFYFDVLLPSYRLNLAMRQRGLLIDWDEWAWRYKFFSDEKVRILDEMENINIIKEFADAVRAQKKKFSLKSGHQMRALLFNLLHVNPSGLKTESGLDSLNSTAVKLMLLQDGLSEDSKNVLNSMLQFAKATTFRGTFLQGIGENLYEDGFLHSEFHNFTESCRRGSRSPNVQNFPQGSPLWKGPRNKDPFNMRMLIRARDGYKFVYPDWAQLEYRLGACYSRDGNMIAGSISPKPNDAHTKIARKFNLIRDHGKVLNFSIIYGASWKRIQSTIFDKTGMVWSEAYSKQVRQGLVEEYEDLFATIKDYHAFIKEHKYVTTPFFGHVRLLPDVAAREDKIRAKALREGWNHVVQSMGHDLLEVVMQRLFDYIIANDLDWWIADDMHDGFLLEVPESEERDAQMICEKLMRDVPKEILGDWQIVPLEAETKSGRYFGHLSDLS